MGFVERKHETLQFTEKGQKVQGRLLAVTTVKMTDGNAMQYKVRREDGTLVSFLGATDVNNKLERGDVGCDVYIEYLGEDESRVMSGNRSRPKLFRVMTDESARKTPPTALAGTTNAPPDYGDTGITDDDIPF